MILIIFHSQ